jgi:hypothetical protein
MACSIQIAGKFSARIPSVAVFGNVGLDLDGVDRLDSQHAMWRSALRVNALS